MGAVFAKSISNRVQAFSKPLLRAKKSFQIRCMDLATINSNSLKNSYLLVALGGSPKNSW